MVFYKINLLKLEYWTSYELVMHILWSLVISIMDNVQVLSQASTVYSCCFYVIYMAAYLELSHAMKL